MGTPLIAFFGADGTGKSTHATLLVNNLQSHNRRVRKVWIRSPHTAAFLMANILIGVGFRRSVLNPFGIEKELPAVNMNRGIRIMWSIMELFSVMPAILFRVYIPLFLGYAVVAERYVVDTIVNVAYYTNDLGFLKSQVAKILLCFIPKGTIFIHLDCDYSTLIKRRGNIVEPSDFISFQRKGYKIMGNMTNSQYFDTANGSIKETFTRIMAWLNEKQGINP